MKIASIASWPPRRCGIASFSADLRRGLEQLGYQQLPVVVVAKEAGEYAYGSEVISEITQDDPESYRQAAKHLNELAPDLVILQHEYGLFGGPDGDLVLGLLTDLQVPVVTVLHTVLSRPSAGQYKVLCRLAELSERLVIIAERARGILKQVYAIPTEKVVHIPHGVPEVPNPAVLAAVRRQLGGPEETVLLSFGLLGPGKGLELAIQAVGEIRGTCPDFTYYIVGATHPNERKLHGEAYRNGLQKLINWMGLSNNVRLINEFLAEEELMAHIAACDIYITPYPGREQISSGTLSFALGLGKPIISTPFIYAEEMLGDGSGLLVPFNDAGQMGRAMAKLICDQAYRQELARKASAKGSSLQWSHVAQRYAELAQSIRRIPEANLGKAVSGSIPDNVTPIDPQQLPALSLDHLMRLTDDTGMLQHACGSIPNRQLGYTTDDNARALLAMVLVPPELESKRLQLAENYLAFLHYAQGGDGWFHNYFSYDRRPLPEERSEDCQGRALWALATTGRIWHEQPLAQVALRMFSQSLPTWQQMRSIRGLSLVIIALATLLRSVPSLGTADCSWELPEQLTAEYQQIVVAAADALVAEYRATAGPGWYWYENILAYSCGLMPAALFHAYGVTERKEYLKVGLDSLNFLSDITVPGGIFQPIGNRSWYPRDGKKAQYDQQPLEGWALTLAGTAAFMATQNRSWLDLADSAERWYLGQNQLKLPLYDARTGGCSDGLHPAGVSENQGAESSLAYVLTRSLQQRVRSGVQIEAQEA